MNTIGRGPHARGGAVSFHLCLLRWKQTVDVWVLGLDHLPFRGVRSPTHPFCDRRLRSAEHHSPGSCTSGSWQVHLLFKRGVVPTQQDHPGVFDTRGCGVCVSCLGSACDAEHARLLCSRTHNADCTAPCTLCQPKCVVPFAVRSTSLGPMHAQHCLACTLLCLSFALPVGSRSRCRFHRNC